MLPVLGAVEAWMTIYNNLPFSIRAFANLTLFMFVVGSMISRLLKL